MPLTKVTYSMINDAPINVKDFGAKGDNVTDDTLAIQAAIDSASNGQTIYFPNGTYITSSALYVGKTHPNVSIIGSGNTIIKSTNSSADVLFLDTVTNCRFSNFTLSHATSGIGNGLVVTSSVTSPSQAYSYYNTFDNINITKCNHGFYAIYSYNTTINLMQTSYCNTGMQIEGGTSWLLNNISSYYTDNISYYFNGLNYSTINVSEATHQTGLYNNVAMFVTGSNNVVINSPGFEDNVAGQYSGLLTIENSNVTVSQAFFRASASAASPSYLIRATLGSNVIVNTLSAGNSTNMTVGYCDATSKFTLNTPDTSTETQNIQGVSGSYIKINGISNAITHDFGGVSDTWYLTSYEANAGLITVTNSGASGVRAVLGIPYPGYTWTVYNNTSVNLVFDVPGTGSTALPAGKYGIYTCNTTDTVQVYKQP